MGNRSQLPIWGRMKANTETLSNPIPFLVRQTRHERDHPLPIPPEIAERHGSASLPRTLPPWRDILRVPVGFGISNRLGTTPIPLTSSCSMPEEEWLAHLRAACLGGDLGRGVWPRRMRRVWEASPCRDGFPAFERQGEGDGDRGREGMTLPALRTVRAVLLHTALQSVVIRIGIGSLAPGLRSW